MHKSEKRVEVQGEIADQRSANEAQGGDRPFMLDLVLMDRFSYVVTRTVIGDTGHLDYSMKMKDGVQEDGETCLE